ncbi:hypothetical protein ACHWQZ_G005427 [Mnemiopsis leidyi]
MNLRAWIALAHLLLTTTSATPYPNCTDPSTYTSYNKTTEYKGLSDATAWDRTLDSGDACDFSSAVPAYQAQTCGDCDFDLEGKTWYRFDQGPYVEIAEYSDNTSCPTRGHCNGVYQIALLSSDVDSGNKNSKMYYVVYSNASDVSKCVVAYNATFMVEEFYCDKFRLYKFPSGWKDSSAACRHVLDETNRTIPTPYSLCMTDTVKELDLTSNRKYFDEVNTLLKCTSEQSPKPPADMMWQDPNNQDITSQAIKDEALSGLFTEVYNLNSSSFSSVTCQVDDKSHTFYRVSIQTENVTGIAGKEVTVSCNFTMDEISENKEDLYFIEVGEDSEIFYNSLNISSRGDSWKIDEINTGIYSVSLTKIRTQSEEWKCGIRDPLTNVYVTVPFTITLAGCDAGEGLASIDSQECVKCRENTYSNSSQNHCEDCLVGEISGKGASRCFQIATEEKAGSFSRQTRAICSVILPRFSDEIEKNLYMIQEKEDEDVYFKENNITTEYKIDVLKVGAGTYNITLAFKNTSVPDNARSRTENWKCAVRDPITKIYTTLPFTVTVNKHCKIGTGFASPEATQCTECPENTFSSNDMVDCEECEEGKISHAGSGECREKPNPGAEFYVIAGVGAALLVILALMIAALIWNKRRQEQQNVVLANPASSENGARLNISVNVLSNETKF